MAIFIQITLSHFMAGISKLAVMFPQKIQNQ